MVVQTAGQLSLRTSVFGIALLREEAKREEKDETGSGNEKASVRAKPLKATREIDLRTILMLCSGV